jgi:FkbM family methyltransferase
MNRSPTVVIRKLAETLAFIVRHPLNRGHKVRALLGFLRWQVGSRLVPGPVVYSWVNGSRLIVHAGDDGLTGNIYCGLHEFAEMAYLLHVMTPEDLFVDVGANAGAYTVLACAVKGARGCCLEPVPSTFVRLLDTLRINGLTTRVEALNLGASDAEGDLWFTSDENCTNHVVPAGERREGDVQVRVRPLDAVLADRSASVLKIDVEGFETFVLAGASATLSRPSLHSVIMELNGSVTRYGLGEDAILGTMAGYGFEACGYEPFSRTLTPLGDARSASSNTVFVRDVAQTERRLKASAPIAVGCTWL